MAVISKKRKLLFAVYEEKPYKIGSLMLVFCPHPDFINKESEVFLLLDPIRLRLVRIRKV